MSDRPAYTLHSLNGGELSRRFEARQDQNKYQSGVFKAENWTPLVLGGLKRRDGTIFVAETKYSGQEETVVAGVDQVFAGADAVVVNEGGGTSRTTVLIPFIFNDEQAYMLEFGDLYVRFFKDGDPILVAGEPYELVTPYPSSMLRHIKMSAYQSADIMYIPSDGTLPMYKLRRIALDPDTFDIFAVNFKTPGSKESELTGVELGNSTLTPGATTGDGVTFTASGSPFLSGDVGMVINGPFGASAIIESFTSSSVVVADIVDPFVDTNPIAPADWSLSGTPSANINPSRARHGGAVTVTADADVFRDAYLGRYILVYGGLIEITRVNGPQKIRGLIRSDLIDRDKINPSETGFWSLEENAWTGEDGYPTAGCFYQERMIVARQQTRWASNTAQFENFAKGNDDSAGFARTLSDDQINDIRWLKASTNGLFSATANGVYQAQASTEGGPLTPNDFNEKPISNLGTANIAPLRVEGTLLYVQESGRSLIEQAFNFIDNKFDSPDLLLRADHLTEFHTLTATAYQQKPDSIMVATRNDGLLLQMVYRRKEDVVGWAPIVTEGTILDVAVIPRPETGHDWVWIVVEREIGGQTLTYIEYFEGFNGDLCREWRAAQTDSAMFTTPTIVDDLVMAADDFLVAGEDFIMLADGDAIGIIGLGHLEGKEVWPIGDGMLFNKALVTNGQITLSPQIGGIASFEVGIPYVSDGLTLEPVIPNEKGGPLMARGWEVAGARVRRTMGLSLNGERIPFRQATDSMDEQIPLKRGKVNVVVQKCDGEGRISFVQDLPFPAEILNIMGRVSIGDEPIPFLIPEEPLPFDCVEPVVEPPPEPPACTDLTARGQSQALLTTEIAFDVANTYPPLTSIHNSWAHISNGELYELVGIATCGGGNMYYTNTCVQIGHWTNDVATAFEILPVFLELPTYAAENTRLGTSDEFVWASRLFGLRVWFDLGTRIMTYGQLGDGFEILGPDRYAIRQGSIWIWSSVTFHLYECTTTSITVLHDYNTGLQGIIQMGLTADRLIALSHGTFSQPTFTALYFVRRSDGTIEKTIDLRSLQPCSIGVVANDLVYILCWGNPPVVYCYDGTNINYVGNVSANFSPDADYNPGYFDNGTFYYNKGIDIWKILIACPPVEGAAAFPTISTDATTVSDGTTVNVSWSDLLVTTSTDAIFLNPYLGAGKTSWPGQGHTPTASKTIGPASSGTTTFTIPVGTAAGQYVFQLCPKGSGKVWAGNSSVFTVT